MKKDKNYKIMKKDDDSYEEAALQEVAYGTQHALNVLIDLLIEKGIVSEQDLRDRLEADINDSPEFDEVNIDLPDEK